MVLKTKKMVRVFFYNGELNFGPLLYLFSFFIVYFLFIFFMRLRRQDYPSEDI